VIDADKNVYVYKTDGTRLGSWTASDLGSYYSGSAPEGIALDGNHLWIVDRATDKLYWYQGAALRTSSSDTAEKQFSVSMWMSSPKGLTTDGTSLWVVNDSTANTVFRFTIGRASDGTPTGLTLAGNWTLDSRNTTPTGITIDPSTPGSSTLWVSDSYTDTVYEYASGRTLTSGSNVAASSTFKLTSSNTDPQDIFDPLVLSRADAEAATPLPAVDWAISSARAEPLAARAVRDIQATAARETVFDDWARSPVPSAAAVVLEQVTAARTSSDHEDLVDDLFAAFEADDLLAWD
jgi:hypothetical protein